MMESLKGPRGHLNMSLAYFFIIISLLIFCFENSLFSQPTPIQKTPELLQEEFVTKAKTLDANQLARIATQNNGRIKPLDSFARETIMFLTGKYGKWGLSASQLYVGLMGFEKADLLELIEVRDVDLRVEIGFTKAKRYYALTELLASPLESIAAPLFEKQLKNKKSLTEKDNKIFEAYSQMAVLKEIISGDHLYQAIEFSGLQNNPENSSNNSGTEVIKESLQKSIADLQVYFQTGKNLSEVNVSTQNLIALTRAQPVPELFQHYLDKLDTEIFYNQARPFFWACIFSLLVGFCFLLHWVQKKLSFSASFALMFLCLLPLICGLGLRVYITRFAPVTNMYGTMIWVALGVILFSMILFALYKHYVVSGALLIGSGLLLLLTEQIPLVLSPEMDPVVAVLRNNFWLSTHVTTITISYSAFTIAMIIGNIALIRTWTHKDNTAFFKEYSHFAYRMIQLGCFLLTVGIILGGVWADYSWGRFWDWDPKETWALIADLGFLSILHARYVGWVDSFSLLAWSPFAYLLVVMAWFGVNFILASGLHSYGFSTGGATLTAVFVIFQITLLGASYIRVKMQQTQTESL